MVPSFWGGGGEGGGGERVREISGGGEEKERTVSVRTTRGLTHYMLRYGALHT